MINIKLWEFADRVASIEQMNTQIATASEEQSAVVKEMNENMSRINHSSDSNAHSVERIATACNQLGSTSKILKTSIDFFSV